MKTNVPIIGWREPWRAIQSTVEIPAIQNQLELEIFPSHPLFGKGASVVARRIDNDDVLVVLDDGIYVNVHLVWGSGFGTFPSANPSWFSYGSLESFILAMNKDATDYDN